VDDLKKKLEECQAQSDNYLDQWRRAAAEFANYKKRAEREQAEATKYCNAALIARLLPTLDDMDRAFQNLPKELAGNPWVEGMALVHRKLHTIFEQEGVREIETEGQTFDPALHEAVTHEPSDTVPAGGIVGEVQKGYLLNDRVLKAAKVRVSAG
jgi:molecular chaperone GrpE